MKETLTLPLLSDFSDALNDPALSTMMRDAYCEGRESKASETVAQGWLSSAVMTRVEFIPDLAPEALTLIETAYIEGCADSGNDRTFEESWGSSATLLEVAKIESAMAETRAKEAQQFSAAMKDLLSTESSEPAIIKEEPVVTTFFADRSPTVSQPIEAPISAPAARSLAGDSPIEMLDSYFKILSHENGELELEVSLPSHLNMMVAQMAAANDQTIQEFLAEAMEEYLTRRARRDASS